MLRLSIDGSWDVEDFVEVLQSLESLYYKGCVSDEPAYPAYVFSRTILGDRVMPVWPIGQGLDQMNAALIDICRRGGVDTPLTVRRISYASPGSVDLIGFGKAMEAVERIVEKLIKFWTEAELRRQKDEQAKVETERQRETLRTLQIKNAKDLLKLRRDFPDMSDEYFVALAVRDQEKLSSRIADGKIVGVSRESSPKGTAE